MTGAEFRQAVGGIHKIRDPSTGEEIDAVINMAAFKKIIKDNLRVLARSSPQDKYILVTGL